MNGKLVESYEMMRKTDISWFINNMHIFNVSLQILEQNNFVVHILNRLINKYNCNTR